MRVKYKVSFGKKPAPKPKRIEPAPVSRAARMLALAYHVERLVESRDLKDYAEAARRLGITRARMGQVMNLLGLSPRLQQRLLTGDLQIGERGIRAVVRQAVWERQDTV